MNTSENSDMLRMTRRDALRTLGAGAALLGIGISPTLRADAAGPAQPALLTLPKLPYAFDALEPYIDARTMEIHYTKHHQAYVNNANKVLEKHPDWLAGGPVALLERLATLPEPDRTILRNNLGGHVNHSFFWEIMAPHAGGEPGGELGAAITRTFGSFGTFKKQFSEAAATRFGSGWAWLVVKEGRLAVESTANQDAPQLEKATPVLGIDVWEHAYYLKHQNRRAEYIAAFWNVVHWERAEALYRGAV